MKRGGYIQKKTPLKSTTGFASTTNGFKGRSRLNRINTKSPSAIAKENIQGLLRQIVILRDKGCILRNHRYCAGMMDMPDVVLQADHLITRANSATYADSRLVVCVCRSCHGWKSLGGNARKAQYDALVRKILSKDRVELWDRAERDSWRPHRKYATDWRLELVALQHELRELKK